MTVQKISHFSSYFVSPCDEEYVLETELGVQFKIQRGGWMEFISKGVDAPLNNVVRGGMSLLRLARLACLYNSAMTRNVVASMFDFEEEGIYKVARPYYFMMEYLSGWKPYTVYFLYRGRKLRFVDQRYFEVLVNYKMLRELIIFQYPASRYYSMFDWASYVYVKNINRPDEIEIYVDLDELVRYFPIVQKVPAILMTNGGGCLVELSLEGFSESRIFDLPLLCHRGFETLLTENNLDKRRLYSVTISPFWPSDFRHVDIIEMFIDIDLFIWRGSCIGYHCRSVTPPDDVCTREVWW